MSPAVEIFTAVGFGAVTGFVTGASVIYRKLNQQVRDRVEVEQKLESFRDFGRSLELDLSKEKHMHARQVRENKRLVKENVDRGMVILETIDRLQEAVDVEAG